MSKKGRARGGTVKRKAGLKHLAAAPPPAAGTMKVWHGGGWATIGWSAAGINFDVDWNVKPTERLTGSIGSHAHWEAIRRVGDDVKTHEVQMTSYLCRIWTTGDLTPGREWTPPVSIGPFIIKHRPDDGDVGLAAKVLAMAAVQPRWEDYKAYVKERG